MVEGFHQTYLVLEKVDMVKKKSVSFRSCRRYENQSEAVFKKIGWVESALNTQRR